MVDTAILSGRAGEASPTRPERHGGAAGPGSRVRSARQAWLWLPLLLLLHTGLALAARIEVSLDRNPVPRNESFTLIFSAEESPDDDPDFSPLERDFEILGQNQSSQFSLSNGQARRSIEWRLTLMAKKTGTLDIPPIAFGSDRSNPFFVTVTEGRAQGRQAAGDQGEIFLEVEAEPRNPYVQAQVVYTLRVLSRVPMAEARLGAPEAADALVEKLDGERQALTTRNGVQYRATEIRYAVFPQKSGHLRIEPARLEVQIPTGGRFPFNQFFGSPGRSRRLQSDAVELEVRPIPPEFTGRHWLPATDLELEDSWAREPPRIVSGEPITRTLTLRAEGATVGLLPELNPEPPLSGDIKQYPDQPSLNEEKRSDGLVGTRREKTALIVSQPGSYPVPAVEIPWWNTRTGRMEVARLPERLLTVLPSARSRPHEPPRPAAEAAPEAGETPAAPPEAAGLPAPAPGTELWFRLAVLFGLGWLATALAWWLSRRPRRDGASPPASAEAPPERRLAAAVESACRANDPAAARQALMAWAEQRWPGAGAKALEQCRGGDLGRELALLDRALYAPGGTDWQGTALWRSFRMFLASEKLAKKNPAEAELEPLYKR